MVTYINSIAIWPEIRPHDFFFKCYGDHRDLHNAQHSFPTRRSSDLPRHPARLLVLVGELGEPHRLAAGNLGPELLRAPLAVALDHRVGGGEDRLRRTVVLLQLDQLGLGEIALEVE